MEYKIIFSSRKTLCAEVKIGGEVLIRAPFGTSKSQIENFIKNNSAWLSSAQSKQIARAKNKYHKSLSEDEIQKAIVKVLEQNDEKIVVIEGRVDTVTVPDLEMKVSPIWDIPAITLVFDCEKMEYISSSGLRIILTAHKKVTAKGGKFIVRNLTREVSSVIDLTGFSRILTIE